MQEAKLEKICDILRIVLNNYDMILPPLIYA